MYHGGGISLYCLTVKKKPCLKKLDSVNKDLTKKLNFLYFCFKFDIFYIEYDKGEMFGSLICFQMKRYGAIGQLECAVVVFL